MTNTRFLSMELTQRLANHLKRVSRVRRAAMQRENASLDAEAWQIATALSDIEESMTKIFGELVPQLFATAAESEAANDLLHDIGEEYRHILYHILDTKIFSYILPEPPSNDDR